MTAKRTRDGRKILGTVEITTNPRNLTKVAHVIEEAVGACAMLYAVGKLYRQGRGVRAQNRLIHKALVAVGLPHDDAEVMGWNSPDRRSPR